MRCQPIAGHTNTNHINGKFGCFDSPWEFRNQRTWRKPPMAQGGNANSTQMEPRWNLEPQSQRSEAVKSAHHCATTPPGISSKLALNVHFNDVYKRKYTLCRQSQKKSECHMQEKRYGDRITQFSSWIWTNFENKVPSIHQLGSVTRQYKSVFVSCDIPSSMGPSPSALCSLEQASGNCPDKMDGWLNINSDKRQQQETAKTKCGFSVNSI